MEKKKNVGKTIVDIVLWVFLAFSIIMTVVAFASNANGGEFPKFGKKCFLTVSTDSMDGPNGFKKGDLIICTYIEKDNEAISQLKKGDVVTFRHDLDGDGQVEINTHRIVTDPETRISGDISFRTRGDKYGDDVNYNDQYEVHNEDIVAIWTGKRIAGLGAVIGFLGSSVGFLCCIILPLACFFVYELSELILTIYKMKEKKAGNVEVSAEQEELIKQKAIEEYLAKQKQETENNEEDK